MNTEGFGDQNLNYDDHFEDDKPYQPKYVRPDPFAKRKNCGEDQPIGGAPNGQYNLNWFDDQNEQK